MSARRVWMVTIPVDVPVVAPSEREARDIALQYLEEAARWSSSLALGGACREMTATDPDRGCIPWNAPDDETVEELLAGDAP